MRTLSAIFFGFLIISAIPFSDCAGQTIRVVGSDFAGAALVLEGDANASIGSYSVDYQMTGSLAGLIKLREGYADLAFVLQTSDDYPALDGLLTVPLGFWGIYFAVTEENPLNEISMTALSEILRKTRDGLKSEWGVLLPSEPKWVNRVVFVSFLVKPASPSFPVLLNEFFGNQIPQNYSAMGEPLDNLRSAGASNLLVLSHLPDPADQLRVLSLIPEDQSVGFTPSSESLYFGDYSLRAVLHIVTRSGQDEKTRLFLQDFFSQNRLDNLVRVGLVPVPQNVRDQALLEFDLEF